MFDTLTSWDNLLLAYDNAARGKRGQANVAAFEHRLEDNLLALQADLRDETYQPGDGRRIDGQRPRLGQPRPLRQYHRPA